MKHRVTLCLLRLLERSPLHPPPPYLTISGSPDLLKASLLPDLATRSLTTLLSDLATRSLTTSLLSDLAMWSLTTSLLPDTAFPNLPDVDDLRLVMALSTGEEGESVASGEKENRHHRGRGRMPRVRHGRRLELTVREFLKPGLQPGGLAIISKEPGHPLQVRGRAAGWVQALVGGAWIGNSTIFFWLLRPQEHVHDLLLAAPTSYKSPSKVPWKRSRSLHWSMDGTSGTWIPARIGCLQPRC